MLISIKNLILQLNGNASTIEYYNVYQRQKCIIKITSSFMIYRKIWTAQEDELIKKLVQDNQYKSQVDKMKWGDIAKYLEDHVQDSKRNGKQCRQRWHNQLNPTINGSEFTKQEMNKVFSLQNQLGNRWAVIARGLPGRTDNSVKNFFYSSLRRALRQLNAFTKKYKSKSNIKPFKQALLNKLLNINEDKYKGRFDIKDQQALKTALKIKSMLAQLSIVNECSQIGQKQIQFRQDLIKRIRDFNKFCKKKKQKKQHEKEQIQITLQGQDAYLKNHKKSRRFINKKSQEMYIEEVKQDCNIDTSQVKYKFTINDIDVCCSKQSEMHVETHQPFKKNQDAEQKILFDAIFIKELPGFNEDYFPVFQRSLSRKQSGKDQMGVSQDFQSGYNKRRLFQVLNLSRRQSQSQDNLQSPRMFASINIGEQLVNLDRSENNLQIFLN